MARTSLNGMGIGGVALLALALTAGQASGQLFENLQAFGKRLDVGDPALQAAGLHEGPKGVAVGDLDGNGTPDIATSNLDGSITVYLNQGGGAFGAPVQLHTGMSGLKAILIADLTGDGLRDIVAAAPYEGMVVLLVNRGAGVFAPGLAIPVGETARDLAAGDFDGDGITDLVVAGSRVGVLELRGGPGGLPTPRPGIQDLRSGYSYESKPVYSLKVLRSPAASRDELIATHAFATQIWILAGGPAGDLSITGQVFGFTDILSLDAAPIVSPAGGKPDLVTAHRDRGTIEVRRGIDSPNRFDTAPIQVIAVPGGPRAVRILDLDGDGWNDLAVILRNLDRVITYRNEGGQLLPSTEMPVGLSPRDMAVADLNGDGQPDLAVINRVSSDVSVLTGYKGQAGFGALDQFYLVDGEVAGLKIFDINKDGRDDVIQLHRAAGDLSVWLAGPGGTLQKPVYYPMGSVPSALEVVDVNGDGFADAVTANLGRSSVDPGSISVRLGDAAGGLGPESRYTLPSSPGGLFSLVMSDLDRDGSLDLAAGFLDCRIGFFKGKSDGSFSFTGKSDFIYEPRAIAAADFDKDGDADIVGASWKGDVVLLENQGDFFMSPPVLHRHGVAAPEKFRPETRDLKILDADQDGNLDILVGSANGARLYLGLPGLDFTSASGSLAGNDFPASSIAMGDFDGDGKRDLAISCQVLSCVTILTSETGTKYVPALTVDVPSGRFIASGDLDGDGKADLVGSGDALWTALSGRRSEPSSPPVLEGERTAIKGPVLNEILAVNDSLPVEQNGGKSSDWVELYNGGPDIDLGTWKVTLHKAADPSDELTTYVFPPSAPFKSGDHLLLLFTKSSGVYPYRTGFRLTGDGGTLALGNPQGNVVDKVDFPPQRPDVSYSRFKDGLGAFVFNLYPSPARANDDNGTMEPAITLESINPPVPLPGQPVRFIARGKDDVGIVSLSVVSRRIDVPDASIERAILYDDGMHEDGGLQDGLFSGEMAPLPKGASVQVYLEAINLSDNRVTAPDEASFSQAAGRNGNAAYSFTVGLTRGVDLPDIQISEVLASNTRTIRDENGRSSDWVEIHNCSAESVPLAGLFLGKRFPASDGWFKFPDKVLAPGEYGIVFCDAQAPDDSGHASFDIDADGDELYLVGSSARGAHAVIDRVAFGPQTTDVAWARSGCGGNWNSASPTPGQPNFPGSEVVRGDVDGSASLNVTDPILILKYLFAGGPLSCLQAAEVNGDAKLDITDAIYLLNYLFLGGPAPTEGLVFCR